jgi:hypothetical protein
VLQSYYKARGSSYLGPLVRLLLRDQRMLTSCVVGGIKVYQNASLRIAISKAIDSLFVHFPSYSLRSSGREKSSQGSSDNSLAVFLFSGSHCNIFFAKLRKSSFSSPSRDTTFSRRPSPLGIRSMRVKLSRTQGQLLLIREYVEEADYSRRRKGLCKTRWSSETLDRPSCKL